MTETRSSSVASGLLRNTTRHLQLTFVALAAACVVGILVAMLAYRSAPAARGVIYVAGLFQTIPSIALLALMIPVFGVGFVPAIVALFLYSLLPIVRNAITALTTVDPVCREVAEAMGMTRREQLRRVLVPLSMPHIPRGNPHGRGRQHRNRDARGIHRRRRPGRADRDGTRTERYETYPAGGDPGRAARRADRAGILGAGAPPDPGAPARDLARGLRLATALLYVNNRRIDNRSTNTGART